MLPYGVRCTLEDMSGARADLKTTLENSAELTEKLPQHIEELKAMATVITVAIVALSVVIAGAVIIGTASKLAATSRQLTGEQ